MTELPLQHVTIKRVIIVGEIFIGNNMLNSHLIVKTEPQAIKENLIFWKDYRITLLADRLFRIEKDVAHVYCDDATLAVWYRNTKRTRAKVEIDESYIKIKTCKVTLVLNEIFENSYIKIGRRCILINNNENLMGTYRTLDMYDGDKFVENGEVRYHIPLETGVVSKNGVAVYDDVKTPILKQDGMVASRPEEEMDLYVFAYGNDYRAALCALYAITGKTPLIPRYALGNWWSRYHAYSDKEYLHILDRLADRDIPMTVATIDMDWHWSTTLDHAKKITESGKNDALHGGTSGWTGYSWNTDLFPDYKTFLKKVADRNVKITLNLHPADGVRYFEDMYRDMAEAVDVDPTTEAKIPFDFTDEKFINAYFDILHKPYEKDGVDFWWIDWQQGCNTAIKNYDPLWGLNHFHYLDNAVNHAPLILSRYSGIGSHRYPLGFSGDTHITWDTMNFIPYFTANATNAGYTWWSHDIGGHMLGENDAELYTRFVQFGVFSPINRLHCSSWTLMTKEPCAFMNGTGLVAEEYLRLRHRLIPYLYSASYETRDHGRALIEPLYYEHPGNAHAYHFPNEYYFGSELLVAPITTPADKSGLSTVKIWLPDGKWTDIFTGKTYQGGKIVTLARWLEEVPVLLKEGGIFVLDGRKHTNDVSNPDILEITVANGSGAYTLHEDDENGNLIDTVFTTEKATAGKQILEIRCTNRRYMKNRDYCVKFRNITTGTVSVTANGNPIAFTWDDNEYLTVTLPCTSAGVTYRIEVTFTEKTEQELRNASLHYSLTRIEYDHVKKSKLYSELIKADDETCRKLIKEFALPATAKIRLYESMY